MVLDLGHHQGISPTARSPLRVQHAPPLFKHLLFLCLSRIISTKSTYYNYRCNYFETEVMTCLPRKLRGCSERPLHLLRADYRVFRPTEPGRLRGMNKDAASPPGLFLYRLHFAWCTVLVRDTHGGGWSRNINARYLHTLMVYL